MAYFAKTHFNLFRAAVRCKRKVNIFQHFIQMSILLLVTFELRNNKWNQTNNTGKSSSGPDSAAEGWKYCSILVKSMKLGLV